MDKLEKFLVSAPLFSAVYLPTTFDIQQILLNLEPLNRFGLIHRPSLDKIAVQVMEDFRVEPNKGLRVETRSIGNEPSRPDFTRNDGKSNLEIRFVVAWSEFRQRSR